MNQLGGLAEDYTKYQEKGAQVIALAVQPQEEAALTVERTEALFPILADDDHVVAEEYGIYNLFSSLEDRLPCRRDSAGETGPTQKLHHLLQNHCMAGDVPNLHEPRMPISSMQHSI